MKVRITVDGRAYEALIESDGDGGRIITIDGDTYKVGAVSASGPTGRRLSVTLDGAVHHVTRGDLHTARVDDVDMTFHLDDVRAGAGAGIVGREGAEIHPPMPGKIVGLRVSEGEAVEAGQVLLVLEAMKMQNEVTSPAAGVVRAIRTKVGANVDGKDVLIVLGPPEEEAVPATQLA